MLTFAKAAFAKSFVSKISNDNKATILGIAAGALIMARLDWEKIIQGDAAELGKGAGAIVAAVIGYYTNKPDKPKAE